METDWLKSIRTTLSDQATLMHKRDYKFFQIDRLERIAEKTDQFASSCKHCQRNKDGIDHLSGKVAGMVNGNAADKRKLEKEMEEWLQHLKADHQIYPVYHFVALFSFYGLAIGIALGFLLAYSFPAYFHACWISSTAIFWVIFYILGSRKDMKARVEKRLI